jgi:para-aminobenzoate synthetase component 1
VDGADALARIDRPGCALLEGWSDSGRWTIALTDPVEEVRVPWGDLGSLDDFLDSVSAGSGRAQPSEAPFQSGWVGYLAYEIGAVWEGLEISGREPREPAAVFYRHESAVAVEPGKLRARRSAPIRLCRGGPGGLRDSLPDVLYREAHEAIRAGIARGDFYQVNLTRRLAVPLERSIDGRALYAALTEPEPPAYSALLRGPGFEIASASPELFLRADFAGRSVESRPIKGTAPRSPDRREDRRLAAGLERSAKDRAENVMIVDLVRNDLGRVCEAGTVAVDALCRLRSGRVHHLESVVRGRLRRGSGARELLHAAFPPGSVTGAPKRAAVAAIRLLEPVPRGVYTGAVGFFDDRGLAAFNVAIRTAVAFPDELRYHAGGGIVWDSRADCERSESDWKSAEFYAALGIGGECVR